MATWDAIMAATENEMPEIKGHECIGCLVNMFNSQSLILCFFIIKKDLLNGEYDRKYQFLNAKKDYVSY